VLFEKSLSKRRTSIPTKLRGGVVRRGEHRATSTAGLLTGHALTFSFSRVGRLILDREVVPDDQRRLGQINWFDATHQRSTCLSLCWLPSQVKKREPARLK
jgi:hypothetical protein